MDKEMTKARLLGLMRDGRTELEALMSQAEEAEMCRSSTPEDWSLKDTLAHLSSWDQFMIAWLEADERGEVPDLPPPSMSPEQVDSFNARMYAEHRDKPLDDVRATFAESFRALLAKAEDTSQEDLLDPNRFAWTAGRPLWYWMAADSYWHYAEHEDQIRRELSRINQ